MPIDLEKYQKREGGIDLSKYQKADIGVPEPRVPESFATTPQPASTTAVLRPERPATPLWAQNLGMEVLGLHKILDPIFDPTKRTGGPGGALETAEMGKAMARRYLPLLKHAGGIRPDRPLESFKLAQQGAKMFEEAPLQTLFDIGILAGPAVGALARGKVAAPRGVKSQIIPKERIPTERVPIVEEVLGVEKAKPKVDRAYKEIFGESQAERIKRQTVKRTDKGVKAAFKVGDEIYETGAVHDFNKLPELVQTKARNEGMTSGFIDKDGKFFTTKEKPELRGVRRGQRIDREVEKGDVGTLRTRDEGGQERIRVSGQEGKRGISPAAKEKPELKPLAPSPRGVKPALVPKVEVAETPTDISIRNVMQALKEAKPARKTQEALFAKERSARLAKLLAVRGKTTGEKGFQAELGQLRGELPKVEFESIRGKISQIDIDNLFNKVKDADILTDWEKITAREGLAKMLTEYGGRVPTRGELTLLEQVFPTEFIEAVMSKRPLGAKLGEAALQLINVPRSIMASFDLSFGGRQGAFAAPKFRRQFWDSWKKQFKIFGSEKAYRASRDALVADKDFKFAKKNRVSFTEIGKVLTQREESFQSQWAEKIPLVGRGVRASGRAYTAFANKYRLDIFKKLVGDAEALGIKPRENPFLTRKMADFVNNATGRGSLGQFENAAVALNAVFFSPRLNMARMRLLNPVYYVRQPKHLRKQALSTVLHAASAATTILTAAKLGGLGVTADPRSADFGKIKIGNTRLDMLAGFGQFIRGAAQITSGQYVSSTTGKTVTLGEGYRPLTRMDLLIRQIESKEAPVASFATGILRGKNWAGEPISIPKEVGSRFVPMVIADAVDIVKDDPSLIPLALPAVFGIGVQTYTKRKRKKKTRSILSELSIGG